MNESLLRAAIAVVRAHEDRVRARKSPGVAEYKAEVARACEAELEKTALAFAADVLDRAFGQYDVVMMTAVRAALGDA